MKWKNIKIFFLMVFNFFCSLEAQNFNLSLEDLVKHSAIITHCKLVKVNSYFNETTKRIYTDFLFENVNTIKGNIKKTEGIKITLYGGTYKGVTTYSPDHPNFNLGEESVLFLNIIENNIPAITKYSIFGSYYGKFDIQKDKEINDLIVLRNKDIHELNIDKTSGRIFIDNRNKLRLGAFINMINLLTDKK